MSNGYDGLFFLPLIFKSHSKVTLVKWGDCLQNKRDAIIYFDLHIFTCQWWDYIPPGQIITQGRWLGHAGLRMAEIVGSLPALRKEIKSICLTIHKVWILAVLAAPRSAR